MYLYTKQTFKYIKILCNEYIVAFKIYMYVKQVKKRNKMEGKDTTIPK